MNWDTRVAEVLMMAPSVLHLAVLSMTSHSTRRKKELSRVSMVFIYKDSTLQS